MSDEKPKQIYRKAEGGFVPASAAAERFYEKTKFGDLVELKSSKPRNIKHHKLFFDLLEWVSENVDGYDSEDQVLHVVKIRMGHCDFVPDGRGGLIAVPRSISFPSMDEVEFANFHRRAIDAVLKLLPAGCDEKTIWEVLSYA
jgi:hypothetical protein